MSEEKNLKECKELQCDYYYFCYAVSNYCPKTGEKIHGSPKLESEFRSKIIALGLMELIKN